MLLHDDWERARAFVPAPAEPGGPALMVPFYPTDADREADVDDPLAPRDLVLAQQCFDAADTGLGPAAS